MTNKPYHNPKQQGQQITALNIHDCELTQLVSLWKIILDCCYSNRKLTGTMITYGDIFGLHGQVHSTTNCGKTRDMLLKIR